MSTPTGIRAWPEEEQVVVGLGVTQKASVSEDAPALHLPRPPASAVQLTFVVEPDAEENAAMTLTATTDQSGVATIAYTRSHPGVDRITVFPTTAPYLRAVATKKWTVGPDPDGSGATTAGDARTGSEVGARASIDRVESLLRAVGVALRAQSSAVTNAVEHRGEAGRARELRLADELRRLLPARFGVTRGAILGRAGEISTDQDLLICDLLNHGAFPYSAGDLVVPESVLAAMQIRTNLSPADIPKHAESAHDLATFIERAVGTPWPGFYCVVAHRLDGNWNTVLDRYVEHFSSAPQGRRIALLAVLDAGVCFDQRVFDDRGVPTFLAGRSQVPGPAFDAVATAPQAEPFVDFYRLLLRGLQRVRPPLPYVPTVEASDPGTVLLDPSSPFVGSRFTAAYAGRSADLALRPGQVGTFTLFFVNVGTAEWTRGTESQCELGVADPHGYQTPFDWVIDPVGPLRYCAQTQVRVAPGSIGTFTFNVVVPLTASAGDHRFYLRAVVAEVGAIVPETRAFVVRVQE